MIRIFSILLFIMPFSVLADDYANIKEKVRETVELVDELKKRFEKLGINLDLTDYDRGIQKIKGHLEMMDRPSIVAVLGMSSTGKSMFVNQYLGEDFLKSGAESGLTKAPLAIFPSSFYYNRKNDVKNILTGLNPVYVSKAEKATYVQETENDVPNAYWTTRKTISDEFILVDLPDVDSIFMDNELHADAVAKIADGVVVLVDDHYNNRELIKHLRVVATLGKSAILVFNKSDIESDGPDVRNFWATAIKGIKEAVDINILASYAIERNFKAALSGESLKVYDVGLDGTNQPKEVSYQEIFDRLSFQEMNFRSEVGALREAISGSSGLKANLNEIEDMQSKVQTLLSAVGGEQSVKSEDDQLIIEWPELPSGLLMDEVLNHWHKKYRGLVTKIIKSPSIWAWRLRFFRRLSELVVRKEINIKEGYLQNESDILTTKVIQTLLCEIERLKTSGVLKGKLLTAAEELLNPVNTSQMTSDFAKAYHDDKSVMSALQESIAGEFIKLKEENPRWFDLMANLDSALAVAELGAPIAIGFGAGNLLAGPMMGHLATSLFAPAVQGVVTVVGGGALAPYSSVYANTTRKTFVATFMQEVVTEYAKARMVWALQWMRNNHLKAFYDLLEESVKESEDPIYNTLNINLVEIKKFIESIPISNDGCNAAFQK